MTNIADELKAIAARSIPALELLEDYARRMQARAYMRDLRRVSNRVFLCDYCGKVER